MKVDKITLAGSVLSFALFALVAKAGGVSAGTAAGLQISLLTAFLASEPLPIVMPFLVFFAS